MAYPCSPGTETDTGSGSHCQRTGLGPIAESYEQLHRVDLLARARADRCVGQVTYESSVRALLQAAEVSILNLARLAGRTQAAVAADDIAGASRYVAWSVGFHRLVRRLGTAMLDVRSQFGTSGSALAAELSITDSAGYRTYLDRLRGMEEVVKDALLRGRLKDARETLATKTMDDPLYRVLHGIRIGCHDATKWELDLSGVPVSASRTLDEFASSATLAEAVAATELDANTLHGEFVALHQVPEILCVEANDHLEAAVRAIRSAALSQAVAHLSVCTALLDPMVEAQRVMAELLATGEYHTFRENLGQASGTHSLAIKQHMFKDLFKHFWTELESWLRSSGEPSLDEAIRRVDASRHDSAETWLRHSVVHHAFRLHSAHQQWRHEHLHMPRNCLGGGGTKSMIGVPDGPEAVYKMRDAANAQRSLRAIHQARRMNLSAVSDSPLARFVADPSSVDAEIMRLVGEATRKYFPHVQEQRYKPFHSGAAERKP